MSVFAIVFLLVLIATVALGLVAIKGRPSLPAAEPVGLLRALLVTLLLVSVVALGLTGFPSAFQHKAVAGYVLILHVMLSGPFLFALAAISVLLLKRVTDEYAGTSAGLSFLTVASFWVLAGTGALTGISMLVAMTPLFGNNEHKLITQHTLVAAHRISSVFAAFSAVLFAVCLFSDVRTRRNPTTGMTQS